MCDKTKPACVNCHFWAINHGSGFTGEVSAEERAAARVGDFTWADDLSLECQQLVWSEGYRKLGERYDVMVQEDRTDFCFFWPHMPNMMFPGADKMRKQANQKKAEAEERRNTRIEIRIALCALGFGVLLEGAQLVYQLIDFYG